MVTRCKIGFITGTFRETMMDDLKVLKPTVLCVVPKVLQTMKKKIFEKFNENGGFVKRLAFKAYTTKLFNFHRFGLVSHIFYDKIIFSKIRAMLGGRLETILCGGAPLPKELADDFKIFLSMPIQEGFGMTELAGSAFATNWHDLTNATAGGVVGCTKLVLKSVPNLNYTINDTNEYGELIPSGEMCIAGPCVFKGYYKNPEETNRAFDEEGYFHTGDIGRIYFKHKNGLKIIDRVKEIFKLSQGEYIIPVKLENVYEKSKYINQICVYGNSQSNHIIGIVQPNARQCSKALNCSEKSVIDMKNDGRLHKVILEDFRKLAGEANFNGLEKLHFLIITFEGFTVENKMLTPTGKCVRKTIENVFRKEIEEIYDKNYN